MAAVLLGLLLMLLPLLAGWAWAQGGSPVPAEAAPVAPVLDWLSKISLAILAICVPVAIWLATQVVGVLRAMGKTIADVQASLGEKVDRDRCEELRGACPAHRAAMRVAEAALGQGHPGAGLALAALVLGLLASSSAWADGQVLGVASATATVLPSSPATSWSDVALQLAAYLLPVVGTALATLLGWALTRLAQRLGVQLSREQQEHLEALALTAVLASEEWAAAIVKAERGQPSGDAKLAHAVEVMRAQVPQLASDVAAALVRAELARLPGIGATGGAVGGEAPVQVVG